MGHNLICIAHRGASGYEPENTLLSFRKALELGARWIECDVRSIEDRAVIFHDRSLRRMTGVPRAISKQTLGYLRTLSLPKGEKIPLLEDALTAFRGEVSFQIELKGANSGITTALELVGALEHGWQSQSFLVSSFDYEELVAFKQIAPTIPVGLLTYGYPLRCVELAKSLGAVSVHLTLDAVSQSRVTSLHEAGLKVFVYTVNEPEEIAFMRELHVDGVFSDFPDRVLQRD